jgi:hypothetical protein
MKTIFTDLEKDIIKELIMKEVHSFIPAESSERYKLEYVDWSDTVEASSGKLSISYKVTADEESDGHDFYILDYSEFVKLVADKRNEKLNDLLNESM